MASADEPSPSIEVDSPWHDGDEAQLRDAERDAWLRGQGYRAVRIEGDDVLKDAVAMAERVASLIQRTLAARRGGSERVTTPSQPAATPTPAPPPLRGRGP